MKKRTIREDSVNISRSVGVYVVAIGLVTAGTLLGLSGVEGLAGACISGAIGVVGGYHYGRTVPR